MGRILGGQKIGKDKEVWINISQNVYGCPIQALLQGFS
jgi:hypothetical protein